MNRGSLLVVGAFTFCTLFAAGAQDSDRAKAEQYIIDCEREWAETAISGDTTKADVFIADDFVGVAPDGSFYDKGLELKRIRESKGSFVWTHLNEVKVRFFGDSAVAQGSENWEQKTGEPKRGRYVWTDTCVMRNHKWQIVAAEDVTVAEVAKK